MMIIACTCLILIIITQLLIIQCVAFTFSHFTTTTCSNKKHFINYTIRTRTKSGTYDNLIAIDHYIYDKSKYSTTLYHHRHSTKGIESRRSFTSSLILNGGTSFHFLSQSPPPAIASELAKEEQTLPKQQSQRPNFTQQQIASFLHPIPTYTIVDKTGTPYMVVGEDAKLSAYFFTTYEEANRILSIASQSVERNIQNEITNQNKIRKDRHLTLLSKQEIEETIGVNPWKEGQARISTLPLDFSVSLASRGKVAGSFFRIAPAESDIEDALEIEKNIDDLAEGKVPLFYINDFEIMSQSTRTSSSAAIGDDSQTQIPLYFQKKQLLDEYRKGTKNNEKNPEVKVTELFSILGQMAGSNDVDEDLKKLVLVPPRGSEKNVKLCEKKGKGEKPYKIGERIVVL